MRSFWIALITVLVSSVISSHTWATEFDGEWEGDGIVTCQIDGSGKFAFRTEISIKNGRFEKSGRDEYVTYSLQGKIDRQGRLNSGVFRFSAPQIGSLGFTLFGKAKRERIDLEFEKLFMDGKIAARDRLCWGKIALKRNINIHQLTSESDHGRPKNKKKESEISDKKSKTETESSNDDPLEAKLEKLKKLLEKGLITEEEAKEKRVKLLGELETEPETRVAAAPEPKAVKAPENKHAVAVIIGNKNYANAHYSVAYAHNDADAIREFVKKQLGYRDGNIIDLRDATSGQFDAVFGTKENHKGKLFDWVRADQSDVIVYYSGHGVPGLKDRRGYLLPVDGDPNRARLTGYPLELLLDNLAKIPARSITVYLDACFSGGSHRGMLVRSASPILVTPRDVEGSRHMVVLTAASGDQLASWDEDKKHGLFTWHLLEALSGTADRGSYGDGNGEVVVSEVKKYLDAEMTYQARRRYGRDQNVWISGEMERVLVQLSSQQN